MNIAINGFGRIGRATFKVIMEKYRDLQVVAINDLTDVPTLAHLLKFDSCYGRYATDIKAKKAEIQVGNKSIKILAVRDPHELPWKELKVDIVLECTGLFTASDKAMAHIEAGAKKVILSAPGKSDDIPTFVMGVNEKKIKKNDKIISNASCTTNCLAPVTEMIRAKFGIEKAIMTTIHSYTADQNLVDGPHKDLRRARAAALNIVPTTTGAALAVTKTIPQLLGKFDGMAVRVPSPVGSMVDAVYLLKKSTSVEAVNKYLSNACRKSAYRAIVRASNDPLVSTDIVGESFSAIIDLPSTMLVGGNLLKLVSWYDNELGYSNRLADMTAYIAKRKLL